jgi:hypothetical protein
VADLLIRHFDRVVLILDGDEAGRQGAISIAQTLGERMSVSAISLEDGCQPDQLAPGDIRRLVGTHDNAQRERAGGTRMGDGDAKNVPHDDDSSSGSDGETSYSRSI